MSRGAAATLVRETQQQVQPPFRQASRASQARLLGDSGRSAAAPAVRDESRHTQQRSVPLHLLDQDYGVVHDSYETSTGSASLRRSNITHPVWLLASLIGLVVLVAVVTPVLAKGGERKVFGRYLGSAPAPKQATAPEAAQQPLIVDATSASPAAPAAPAQAHTSANHDITGGPSVSVGLIESVLAQYGSPAVGHGQSLYDLGLKYGVNPAYALAFFVHESGCGTKGVARFTHSIGNIRWTEGYDNYEGYRSYGSWEQGMDDWYRLITELYIGGWHLRTVDAIVPVYAPSGDNNNPPGYIAAVKDMVDSWRGK